MTGKADRDPSLFAVLASTSRRDALAKAALLTLAAAVLAFVYLELAGSPFVYPDQPAKVPRLQRILLPLFHLAFVTLILLSLAWRLGEVAGAWQRAFWKRLEAAYGCWFLGAAAAVLLPEHLGTMPRRPIQVVFYALAYLILIRALERPPHLPAPSLKTGAERLLAWPAATFFVLGLTIYFVFVPQYRSSGTASDLVSELYYFVLLDAYLVARLAYLSWAADRRPWRWLYAALLLPWIFVLATDVSLVAARTVPGWPLESATWLSYNFSLVLLVLAIRLRHHPSVAARSLAGAESPLAAGGDELSLLVSARTLALGVAFPVLHLVAYRFELLDASSHDVREALVLAWLIAFGVIALVQHRQLERHAQTLWLDRVTFEEQLRESEEDLRLIIERNRAEAVRQELERRFDDAFRACPYTLAISSLKNGRFLEANPAFEQTFGFAREEVIGRSAQELGLWSDPADLARVNRRIAGQREIHELEIPFLRKSGKPFLALVSAAEIELAGERCLLSIVHDVGERRRAEQRLQATAEIVDRAAAAILELDADGRVRSWSAGAERLSGRAAPAVVGRPASELLGPADALAAVRAEVEWRGELELAGAGGTAVPVAAWSSRLADEGESCGVLVIAAPYKK